MKLRKLPTVSDYINDSVNNSIIGEKEIEISRHKIYSNSPILKIKNLDKYYIQNKVWFKKRRSFKALNDISLELYKGETLGLVGESGCGKSTLVKTIVQIEKASNGSIFYKGTDITKLSKSKSKKYRKDVQLIFQDPDSSLNPKKTIGYLIMEPMIVHEIDKKNSSYKILCLDLLEDVGLKRSDFYKYPHELSGGQKQRVGIARAISVAPKILICDESVSALDVSVQAQVLNLLNDLKAKLKLTYIFISHDLSIVKYMADKIIEAFNNNCQNKKISILGLSFKPETDDMRDSPSLDIIPILKEKGFDISVFDPVAMDEAKKLLKNIEFSNTIDECLQDSDGLVILTEWNEFRSLSATKLKKVMKGNILIDLRNSLNPDSFQKSGFNLIQLGRPKKTNL